MTPSQPVTLPYHEKQSDYYAPTQTRSLPPPAYAASSVTRSLATALALYEYQPSDAGDLAILPNDRIAITEFMNADWAKGRNERTGLEGIFPRSYVEIVEEREKNTTSAPPPPARSNYGNLPLDVSQSGGSSAPGKESKLNENGKKFGKKMGNAGQSAPTLEKNLKIYNNLLTFPQLSSALVLQLGQKLSTGFSSGYLFYCSYACLYQKKWSERLFPEQSCL